MTSQKNSFDVTEIKKTHLKKNEKKNKQEITFRKFNYHNKDIEFTYTVQNKYKKMHH